MSFLDMLKEYKQSDNTTLHEVLLGISTSEKTIHIFFEGKTDESFYKNSIKKYYKNYAYKTYKSGNKKSCYYFCEQLHARKNEKNIFVFFVDKDLDDIIPIT
ncbi:hypothetical protein AGMMS49940_09350 [Spirochaetia bacterium]|nr:hypothetical protein AGMMS49940_09350 [Spirochaetia bacterium]